MRDEKHKHPQRLKKHNSATKIERLNGAKYRKYAKKQTEKETRKAANMR